MSHRGAFFPDYKQPWFNLCSRTYSLIRYLSTTHYTKRYMSSGHSANLRVRLTSSDWLKVDFWIHGPVLFVGLLLYDVSAAT